MVCSRFSVYILISFSLLASPARSAPTDIDFRTQYDAYKKLVQEGDWGGALDHARRAYEIGKVLIEQDDIKNATLAYNYGYNLFELLRYDEADKLLKEALQLYETGAGKNSQKLIPLLIDIGNLKVLNGEKSISKYYDRALKISGYHFGKNTKETGQLSIDIGAYLLYKARSNKADKYLYKGLKILQTQMEESSAQVVNAIIYVGIYENSVSNYKDGVKYLSKALSILENTNQSAGLVEINIHQFLMHAYVHLMQPDLVTKHSLAMDNIASVLPDYVTQTTNGVIPKIRPMPIYPFSALRHEQTGSVTLIYDIDEGGIPQNIRVLEYTGTSDFVDSSIEAVNNWRYTPKFIDGKPVITTDIKTRLDFDLE